MAGGAGGDPDPAGLVELPGTLTGGKVGTDFGGGGEDGADDVADTGGLECGCETGAVPCDCGG